MDKLKIKHVLKDRNNFLEDYIKDILPSLYYRNSFYKKIKDSHYINAFELSHDWKKQINNYWNQFKKINLMWHKAYIATNNIKDVRYIPEDVFYKNIEPYLNNYDFSRAYSDKNMYDSLFEEYKMPKTIIRNMKGSYYDSKYNNINIKEVIDLSHSFGKNNKMVLKPSIESGGGRNVKVIDVRKKTDHEIKDYFTNIFEVYDSDFILQEYLKQHNVLNEIHKDSLNTLRIISLRYNNKIYILSNIVRMGNNGSKVDNATVGGLTCGFNDEGILNSYATDHLEYKKYDVHPYSNFRFKGTAIPNPDKCFNLVKNAHKKLLYFDMVSWDLAIDQLGEPHLIEVNLKLQDINFHQRNNGPLFGDLTDSILSEVF